MEECNLHTIVRAANSCSNPTPRRHQPVVFEKGTPTKDSMYWEHLVPRQKAYSMTKPSASEHLKGCYLLVGRGKRKAARDAQAWKVTAEDVKRRVV